MGLNELKEGQFLSKRPLLVFSMRIAAKRLNRGFGRNILFEFLRYIGDLNDNNSPNDELLKEGFYATRYGIHADVTKLTNKGIGRIETILNEREEEFLIFRKSQRKKKLDGRK